MMRLLVPVKYVLVDQETGVLMKLAEQLALMMTIGRHVVSDERIDDRDPYP